MSKTDSKRDALKMKEAKGTAQVRMKALKVRPQQRFRKAGAKR